MFYFKKNKRGFTLVELLIVIAVIIILVAVMVPNLRRGEENTRLIRAAQQVIQDIRKAQNMSLSSTEVFDVCGAGEWRVCDYYGVYFDEQNLPTSYHIFGSVGEDEATYNPGEEIETKELEQGIIVEDVSTGNKTHLTFIPPYSSVNFVPSTDKVIITLKISGGSCPEDCIYIAVNNNGWIGAGGTPGELVCPDGAGSDDSACGIIDCDGLNYYFTEGDPSPIGTNYCKYRDYDDITTNRCEGIGDCKDPNSDDCTSYSDSTVATCGLCKYAEGACSSCTNYSEGTSCGADMECDGEGNCVEIVICPDGAGSDDDACGIIDCSLWYEQTGVESATDTEYCYNKQDITSERCEGVDDCKDSNTSDCSTQPNDELKYECGICKYIDNSDCSGTTLGSCTNYPAGTSCGTDKECDGNGDCTEVGHVYLNPRIDNTPLECDNDEVNEFCDNQGYGCTNWDWTCGVNPQSPTCMIIDNPTCAGDAYPADICPTAVTQIVCH